jgi:hypothetical protein
VNLRIDHFSLLVLLLLNASCASIPESDSYREEPGLAYDSATRSYRHEASGIVLPAYAAGLVRKYAIGLPQAARALYVATNKTRASRGTHNLYLNAEVFIVPCEALSAERLLQDATLHTKQKSGFKLADYTGNQVFNGKTALCWHALHGESTSHQRASTKVVVIAHHGHWLRFDFTCLEMREAAWQAMIDQFIARIIGTKPD